MHHVAGQCTQDDVRLVDGPTMYEGRVEVCDSGAWGTVCGNAWDSRDVAAVCAQLGFGIGKLDGNKIMALMTCVHSNIRVN